MKNLKYLNIIFNAFLLVSGIILTNSSYAACAANTSPSASCDGLDITSTVSAITINSGITVSTGLVAAVDVQSSGVVTTFTNNGAIGSLSGLNFGINYDGRITTLINNGTIQGYEAILQGSGSTGSIGTLINSGRIESNDVAIQTAAGGSIGSIVNSGSIVSLSASNGTIRNNGTINVITNTGAITNGSGPSIRNTGIITTLNNAQSGLTYSGNLPTNYNLIANGQANYGSLSVSSVSGSTNFGIYAGSVVSRGLYSQVLSGVSASNVGTKSGTYQGLSWTLVNSSGTIWDLTFSGSNTAVTAANNITAQGLQTAFALQNTVLVNGFTYDCPLFDKNNVCVSAGGRYTAVDAQSVNSGAAVLIGAYRWNNQVRLGAYIDQNVSTNTTGIIKVSNASPMIGLFGVWSERLDGTGAEVKVSAGYGQKNTTMTRPVIDGTEPGSGSSTLTSQGAQAIGKYGFAVADKTILSPYAGLRYTQNNMNGYTENASASVTAPLTYAPLNTNATTVVAGLGATYKVVPAVTLLASAGVEADTNTQYSSYSATGLYGLTPINMNPNPKYTRPTGMLGAYYDVEKNQRISLTGVYRQAPYQGVGATTYMALYTIGL